MWASGFWRAGLPVTVTMSPTFSESLREPEAVQHRRGARFHVHVHRRSVVFLDRDDELHVRVGETVRLHGAIDGDFLLGVEGGGTVMRNRGDAAKRQ